MAGFDSHNHLQYPVFEGDQDAVVAEMERSGVRGCVVNGTEEADWGAVRALAERFPEMVRPAYGVHPWKAGEVEAGWEVRLRELLEKNPGGTVGEVGVDGWVKGPGMEEQKNVFAVQARLAAELGRVMTVHCLQAWGAFFEVMDEASAWPEKFLMHSFGGSYEVAERIMKHEGAMFSFSGYFLEERKHKVRKVFRRLPIERILLETDAPDMLPPAEFRKFPGEDGVNHPGNWVGVAEGFCGVRGKDELGTVWENSRRFWGV